MAQWWQPNSAMSAFLSSPCPASLYQLIPSTWLNWKKAAVPRLSYSLYRSVGELRYLVLPRHYFPSFLPVSPMMATKYSRIVPYRCTNVFLPFHSYWHGTPALPPSPTFNSVGAGKCQNFYDKVFCFKQGHMKLHF